MSWPDKPDPNAEVVVTANGSRVGALAARPGWEEVELALPANISSGLIVIELQTRAQKPPGPELRSLGVTIDFVTLERSR